MDSLCKLIENLRLGEINYVRNLYQSRTGKENQKRVQLFELILDQKVKDEKDAISLLYDKVSPSGWSQLKSRLRSDILNIILLQDSNAKYKTAHAQAAFECRRALMQGEILLARGLYEEGMNVLKKALSLAEDFELAAELISLGDLIRNHTVFTSDNEQFNKDSMLIEEHVSLLEKIQNAKFQHYHITLSETLKGLSPDEYRKEGKRILKRIRRDYLSTRSVKIAFYFHLTAMHYHTTLKEFDSSFRHGKKLSRIIESNKIVHSSTNIGGINLEMAQLQLQLGNPTISETHCKKALSAFKKGMLNGFNTLETMFLARTAKGELTEAQTTLKRIFHHKKYGYIAAKTPFKWQVYQSGIAFSRKRYSEALRLIRTAQYGRQKSVWYIGLQLTEVMVHIESKSSDWLEDNLENYIRKWRRQMEEHPCEPSNKRFFQITLVLKALHSKNYEWAKTVKCEALELLSAAKDEHEWHHGTAEFIRFDAWFMEWAGLNQHENSEQHNKVA